MRWDDVNVRARGLATHLLGREALLRVAGAERWPEFIGLVADAGYPMAGDGQAPAGPADFDRATAGVVAARLGLLGRWLGARREVLAVVYEDEERRTVRALLRGVVEGASPPTRLRAIVPTGVLRGRALERLAGAASPADLARQLRVLGHPAGRALEVALSRAVPSGLFGLELALGRVFAVRATRAARRGGLPIRALVQDLIDLENAWALLAVEAWRAGGPPDEVHLPGGRRLTPDVFARISALVEDEARAAALRELFRRSAFADVFAEVPLDPVRLEARALQAHALHHRTLARRDPLGVAVLLHVIFSIRREARDLRSIAWGIALGTPVARIAGELVTP